MSCKKVRLVVVLTPKCVHMADSLDGLTKILLRNKMSLLGIRILGSPTAAGPQPPVLKVTYNTVCDTVVYQQADIHNRQRYVQESFFQFASQAHNSRFTDSRYVRITHPKGAALQSKRSSSMPWGLHAISLYLDQSSSCK